MRSALRHTIILALFAAFSAQAADTPSPPPEKDKDGKLEAARAAIAKQDWAGAQGILRGALAADKVAQGSADYHNLFAYAMRKAGTRDMDLVFKHYNEALRLNAKHRGAHEYIGEAYLLVGNLAKAKEHLKALDGLCTFGCAEYSDLKQAVSAYESKQARK
jgi:tetratricopeptide (TPR) repeat protein